MADLKSQFQEVVAKFNLETNRLAAIVAGLKTKVEEALAKAGISAEDEAALLAEFTAVAGRLEQIGADPADPVPAPPVVTEPE